MKSLLVKLAAVVLGSVMVSLTAEAGDVLIAPDRPVRADPPLTAEPNPARGLLADDVEGLANTLDQRCDLVGAESRREGPGLSAGSRGVRGDHRSGPAGYPGFIPHSTETEVSGKPYTGQSRKCEISSGHPARGR
jgi:hypothetical protein